MKILMIYLKEAKAKTISKQTVHSQLVYINFSCLKVNILIRQVNVRTLDRVSELRAHYRNKIIICWVKIVTGS